MERSRNTQRQLRPSSRYLAIQFTSLWAAFTLVFGICLIFFLFILKGRFYWLHSTELWYYWNLCLVLSIRAFILVCATNYYRIFCILCKWYYLQYFLVPNATKQTRCNPRLNGKLRSANFSFLSEILNNGRQYYHERLGSLINNILI